MADLKPGQEQEAESKRPMPTVTADQALASLNEFTRFWHRVGGDQGDAPDAHLTRRFIEQQRVRPAAEGHGVEAVREARLSEVRSLRTYIHSREKHVPVLEPDKCQFQICIDLRQREAALASAAQPAEPASGLTV
jgi:hypothetical protein